MVFVISFAFFPSTVRDRNSSRCLHCDKNLHTKFQIKWEEIFKDPLLNKGKSANSLHIKMNSAISNIKCTVINYYKTLKVLYKRILHR